MEKEGKVDLLSVLIVSILIIVVYAVLVLGEASVVQEFPANFTNASATKGIVDSSQPTMSSFNGTLGLFQCNITSNATAADPSTNVSNVSLFIQEGSPGTRETAVRNATINSTGDSHIVLNATETGVQIVNFTNETTMNSFDEGEYFWFCEVMTNSSSVTDSTEDSFQANFTTLNRSFIIDKTAPGIIKSNVTNTSNSVVSTNDNVSIQANFTDQLTAIRTVVLFVNISGIADNEVGTGTNISNLTLANFSFKIPGNQTGQVLNFTLRVNDSVDNVNNTPALVFSVDGDGTPPGPINLSNPIDLFNTSSASALQFNFSAVDNNDTTLTADINISQERVPYDNISNIEITSGVAQLNTSTRSYSNGTYTWNVTVRDSVGNQNTSVSFNFTVDQIPPVASYFNITNVSAVNATGDPDAEQLGDLDPSSTPADGFGTWAQGRKLYGVANWSDNLTRIFEAELQAYNWSSGNWITVNTTVNDDGNNITPASNGGWSNFTFTIPGGHNIYEGANVSFRIIANDTLGNVNSSASVRNLTIQINDTTVPEITINGTLSVNGTNITNTRPIISWSVNELSALTNINVSVDGNTQPTDVGGVNTQCNKAAFYSSSLSGDNNVETGDSGRGLRNFSFQISASAGCPLANGTHFVNVTATDTWGNNVTVGHTFSVQSGSFPALVLNNLLDENGNDWSRSTVNNSNITSAIGLNFSGTNGVGASVANITYISSCNSSKTDVMRNNTAIYPFNSTSDVACGTTSANRTLTLTVTDTAGNSNTTVFGFLVDNVGPSFTSIISPKEGQTFTDEAAFNFSFQDNDQAVSSFGYFLDGENTITIINVSNGAPDIGGAGVNTNITNLTNLTAGTHSIKFTANDTLGNTRNSSVISFVQTGPVNLQETNASMTAYAETVFKSNITNVTLKVKTDAGFVPTGNTTESSSNTFEIIFEVKEIINISLTEVNGTAVNWNKINFTPVINDTKTELDISNNWTNKILNSTVFNNSIAEFIGNNNSYFGVVLLPFNLSGTTATAQEFWWITDEDTLASRTNISQCTSAFTATTTTPCWNYTSGGYTVVQVPHFSIVAAVNDTSAPTVNVTAPESANQSVGTFKPNITVSSDAISCVYSINSSVANKSMTKSGTTCLGSTENFKNLNSADGNYNLTFTVNDSSGNVNTYFWKFNVTDGTAPNTPNSSRISTSPSSTSATVTISGINESVNATVQIANGSSISPGNEVDFSQTQEVTVSGLSASTEYHFNVTICDFNGNCAVNSTGLSFTTSAASSATTTTTTTTTSGGGGGGGGAAAISTVTGSKAQVWQSVPKGSSVSLNVDKAEIAVTSVSVNKANADLNNVEIEVAALSQNPVSTEAAAKVYQYLRITKKNLKDEDAENFKVVFRVTKSWLTENGLASGDLALYRFADSQWNELVTRVSNTDSTYVNYEADTPGFSSFAIGVRSSVEIPEEAPVGEETEKEAPGEKAPPEAVEKPKPVEVPAKAPVAWLIAVLVVVLGIVLIVVYQKQKKKI